MSPPETQTQEAGPTAGARIAAVAAMVVLLAVVLLQIYRTAPVAGRVRDFAYTQDEAYVNLMIARELAGQDAGPDRFGGMAPLAGTASPGWVVLLAALMRTFASSAESAKGLEQMALLPLVLNGASTAALVLLAGHLLRREVTCGGWMFVLLAGMGVLMPLLPAVMAGTEHVLQAVVMLLSVAVGIRAIEHEASSLLWMAAAALMTFADVAVGPIGLAALAGLLLWAWSRGRGGRMLLACLAGFGLAALSSAYLVRTGGALLANPLLIGASGWWSDGWRGLGQHVWQTAQQGMGRTGLPLALLLIGIGLLGFRRGDMASPVRAERERVAWLFVFAFVALVSLVWVLPDAHDWQRAFLVPMGFVAIGRTLAASGNSRACTRPEVPATLSGNAESSGDAPEPASLRHALVVLICLVPLIMVAGPALRAFAGTPLVSRDALIRHRAAAAFVRTYFPGGPVAVSRAGSVGYETDARLVDLSGVLNRELAMAKVRGAYTPEGVARVVEQGRAQVALISGALAEVPISAEWKPIGGWHREGAARDAASAVRVYSVSPAMESDVRIALRLFSESAQPAPGIDYWFAEQSKTRPAELAGRAGEASVR